MADRLDSAMDELFDSVISYVDRAEGGMCQERHGGAWPNCDDTEHADGKELVVVLEWAKYPQRWVTGLPVPPLSFENVSTDDDIAADRVRFQITG